jgi:cell division protein FtsI/penicillin-binding protein 2
MAILVEHGLHGASAAAPIAKAVAQEVFKEQKEIKQVHSTDTGAGKM